MFRSFTQYLLEQTMTVKQALEVLGLTGVDADPQSIKKAYRSASMKAHPDRGGSTEAMQRVNAAYNVLKDKSFKAGSSKEDVYGEEKVVAKQFMDMFDVAKYRSYLSELFGVSLSERVKEVETRYSLNKKIEFASKDRETVINILLTFMYNNFKRTKSLGSGDSGHLMPSSLSISTEILHNRQKIKPKQKNYQITNNSKIFTDPEVVFPSQSIKRQIDIEQETEDSGSVRGGPFASPAKKMKKRDFITTLKNKFPDGDMVKGDVFQIRRNGITIQGNRQTMMRQGLWQISIFPSKLRGSGHFMPSLPETDVSLQYIINLIQEIYASSKPERTWARYVDTAKENAKAFWAD